MQPLDANKAPKVHVPPLNHIGIWVSRATRPVHPTLTPRTHTPLVPPSTPRGCRSQVDPIEAAVAHLSAQGVRFAPGGIRKGAP